MSSSAFCAVLSDLILEIEQEVDKLLLVYDRQKNNLTSEDPIDQLGAASGLASIVSKIYTKSEDVFHKVAQKIDGDVPKGDGWHALLLRQMKTELVERPAFLAKDSFAAFDHLRRFRHFERNSYASNIDSEMISEKVAVTVDAVSMLRSDFLEFSYKYFEVERPGMDSSQDHPRN